MSAFTIINDISLELRNRVYNAMNSAVGVNLGFTDEATNILLEQPQESAETGSLIYLYLYHIGINNALRNQQLLPSRTNNQELRLPPLPLELRFIATPVADEETNRMIVGRLLQFVYDNPRIDSLSGSAIGDSFGGASKELRITPDLLNVEQLSQLWNAFNQPFRLSLAFQVDVVAVDSVKMPVVAPRVSSAVSLAGSKERNQ